MAGFLLACRALTCPRVSGNRPGLRQFYQKTLLGPSYQRMILILWSSLVTPATSLIVLSSLSQYVLNQIEPPKHLPFHGKYLAIMAKQQQQKEDVMSVKMVHFRPLSHLKPSLPELAGSLFFLFASIFVRYMMPIDNALANWLNSQNFCTLPSFSWRITLLNSLWLQTSVLPPFSFYSLSCLSSQFFFFRHLLNHCGIEILTGGPLLIH